MNTPAQQIHLWPEILSAGPHGTDGVASPWLTPVPVGSAPRRLTPSATGFELLDPRVAPAEDSVLVEPFRNACQQPRLLVSFPHHLTPRVNGEPGLRRVVLKVGDAFQWRTGLAVHVSVFNIPQLGLASATQLGKVCPVCRVPFTANSVVYTCACGAVYHCEADETNGLQCAQLRGECLRCKRAILLEEGYAYTPSQDE